MFKTHYDPMRPGPTPERVLAIARMVAQQPMTAMEIAQHCELQASIPQISEGVRLSIAAAEELGLITKKDGVCTFCADSTAILSPDSFRRFVSSRVFADPETSFFKASEWFLSANDAVLSLFKFDTYAAEMGKSGLEGIHENDVLGWRFWVRFLGVAYQYNNTLIPNMTVRLRDAMQQLPTEEPVSAMEFLTWLRETLPETAASCSQRQLCLAVSNGLHTLQALQMVELISVMDAEKVNLFPMAGATISNFSKIVVKEALRYEMA